MYTVQSQYHNAMRACSLNTQYIHEQFTPLPYGLYITVTGARGYVAAAAMPRPLGQNTGSREVGTRLTLC